MGLLLIIDNMISCFSLFYSRNLLKKAEARTRFFSPVESCNLNCLQYFKIKLTNFKFVENDKGFPSLHKQSVAHPSRWTDSLIAF